jgi:hypothetical protein
MYAIYAHHLILWWQVIAIRQCVPKGMSTIAVIGAVLIKTFRKNFSKIKFEEWKL